MAQFRRGIRTVLRCFFLAALLVATIACERHDAAESLRVEPPFSVPDAQPLAPLGNSATLQLANTVAQIVHDEPSDDLGFLADTGESTAVYVALRAKGKKFGDAWAAEATLKLSLEAAVALARSQNAKSVEIDTVELVVAHNFEPFEPNKYRVPISNVNRGVTGLELRYRNRLFMLSPTRMLAENKSFNEYINALASYWGLSDEQIMERVRFRSFEAEQFLIRVEPTIDIERMFRGNQVVTYDAVDRDNVVAMAERLSEWMLKNLHADGRMTYMYVPGKGEIRDRNNVLRQWMATVSLMQIVKHRGDADSIEAARRNMRYNLDNFYRVENEFGIIEYANKAKLGAIAIATAAIMSSPERSEYAAEEAALLRTIDYLWRDHGSFQTFYKPAGRNDVQNFYPGETLLTWATLYRESLDAALLAKIMKSYEYYRAWHLENRNPAFIPWHTRAYYLVWQQTGDPALAAWVFEMNDWLLDMQGLGWPPDTDGRFYDPSRPFGPPHASSTAVYLEGLIDAFALARELRDEERTERYRVAIVRGLRSLMQLEFADNVDMFYVTNPDRVYGGLRTTVYDSMIRVDNVQHTLMGLMKILATFSEDDYAL
jgi:hypothetical protein